MTTTKPVLKEKKTKRLFFGLDIDDKQTAYKLLGIVVGAWALCGVSLYIIFYCSKNPWTERGQFGDMFGAINALFSGLAFAGIIYTILLQREELSAQREELVLTRDELRGQKEEFQTQNTTLKRQRFEAMFFNMLAIHFQTIDRFRYDHFQSINGFVEFVIDFKKFYNDQVLNRNGFRDSFSTFTERHLSYFMQYIQSLLQLLRVIKENKFKNNAEQRYIAILRGYISLPEKEFLSYFIVLGNYPLIVEFEREVGIINDLRSNKSLDINLEILD